MSVRYLADINAAGVVIAVVKHVGPPASHDHGLTEVSEAYYNAVLAGKTVRRASGEFKITERAPGYAELRAEAYPTIGDQLDALFKAMHSGTLPMVHDFYYPIASVKARFPKP